MKIAVVSDLHVEFDRDIAARLQTRGRKPQKGKTRRSLEAKGHPLIGPNFGDLVDLGPDGEVNSRADLVILAGDIDLGRFSAQYARDLAAWLGVPTVLIAGNHEFYDSEYDATHNALQQGCDGETGVCFLERTRLDIGIGSRRVRVLGCTLWTDFRLFGEDRRAASMRAAEQRVNDFRGLIRFGQGGTFSPMHAAVIFAGSVDWLRAELADDFDGPTIVVTHHAPSAASMDQQHKRDLTSAAYASQLDGLIEDAGPALWVHGHMHHCLDYRIGKTRVICNPRGYKPFALNKKFQPGLLVEV